MGNITTVIVLNDFAHEIKRSTVLQERLVQMLGTGERGEVIPGVKIVDTHHNDYYSLVRVGGGVGRIVEGINNLNSNDVEALLNKYEAERPSWPLRQAAIVEIRKRIRTMISGGAKI